MAAPGFLDAFDVIEGASEVWFRGVHSDIGGGYAETGLSDLAMAWMIEQATTIPDGLVVDMTKLNLQPSFEGLQHDVIQANVHFYFA